LSDVQQQLISIDRSLINNPSILVLDDSQVIRTMKVTRKLLKSF
jgi:ABC-type methionine transport system ATPase subunit